MCPWVYILCCRQSTLCHWRLQEYFIYTHILSNKSFQYLKKNIFSSVHTNIIICMCTYIYICWYVSNRFYFVNLDFFNSHTSSVYYSRKSQHPLKISSKTRKAYCLCLFFLPHCVLKNFLFIFTSFSAFLFTKKNFFNFFLFLSSVSFFVERLILTEYPTGNTVRW